LNSFSVLFEDTSSLATYSTTKAGDYPFGIVSRQADCSIKYKVK